MSFDDLIDRHGTHCSKWDMMEQVYGVPREDGLAMWVADTDYRAPAPVLNKIRDMVEHGVFGYVNCDQPYKDAIRWWMRTRHDWAVDADAIFTTTGLVNGVGMCLDTFTEPGDGVVLFTPVYHAFAKVIRNAGREVVECLMVNNDGRYEMDFEAYDAQMTGKEKMVILCSPHNPGGRVWTQEELQAVADFAKRHDLLLLSDEIHHDLVYPGHTHIPMQNAAPEITDRLLMLTAPSKTFNIAGLHTGQVIIPDQELRGRFAKRMAALSLAPNSVGQLACAAAYSAEGAQWVDDQVAYLDENRRVFDSAIAEIPRPEIDAFGSDLSLLGRFLGYRHGTHGVHQPGRTGGPHRGQSWHHIRDRRRELSTFQPRDPTRPDRRSLCTTEESFWRPSVDAAEGRIAPVGADPCDRRHVLFMGTLWPASPCPAARAGCRACRSYSDREISAQADSDFERCGGSGKRMLRLALHLSATRSAKAMAKHPKVCSGSIAAIPKAPFTFHLGLITRNRKTWHKHRNVESIRAVTSSFTANPMVLPA